ncbi:hypothetical protein EsH8_VI_000325 [Colletotrichum jinshuiense]
MDATSAPGAVPAIAGIEKVPETAAPATETGNKATEPVAAETKPVEEKEGKAAKLEEPLVLTPPADVPAAAEPGPDAPKPASVEEVPDQDGPVATTGVDESKAVPTEQSAVTTAPASEPVKESVEEPIAQEPVKAPVVEEEPIKEPIIEKPEAVNGTSTKDVEMTGALNDAEATGAGEPETASLAIPSEGKTGAKRKADELNETNGANGANGAEEETVEDKPAEKKVKTGKPGRPATNGAAKPPSKKDSVKESPNKETPRKEKESLGHKVARNVKKVISPVGRTARKTRSQGPV